MLTSSFESNMFHKFQYFYKLSKFSQMKRSQRKDVNCNQITMFTDQSQHVSFKLLLLLFMKDTVNVA